MVTNYQVVAEAATRAVVRFNGTRVNNVVLTNDVLNGPLLDGCTVGDEQQCGDRTVQRFAAGLEMKAETERRLNHEWTRMHTDGMTARL